MAFKASTTGARLLGGLSGANYRGKTGMGNAYLRARDRMAQARSGADSIEAQSRIAADQTNRNATRNMFGSFIGGLGRGVVSGLGNMGQQPDSSRGYEQYVVDPGFDTRIDMRIPFNPSPFTFN